MLGLTPLGQCNLKLMIIRVVLYMFERTNYFDTYGLIFMISCIPTFIRTYISHTHIYVQTHIHIYARTYTHIYAHICTHIYVKTHIHTHIYAHTYTHVGLLFIFLSNKN